MLRAPGVSSSEQCNADAVHTVELSSDVVQLCSVPRLCHSDNSARGQCLPQSQCLHIDLESRLVSRSREMERVPSRTCLSVMFDGYSAGRRGLVSDDVKRFSLVLVLCVQG